MNISRPYNFKKAEGSRGLIWFCVLVLFAVSAALLGLGLDALYENYLFDAKAVHIQAIVDQKFDQALPVRFSFRHTRYISYSYVANATAYTSAKIPVSYATWTRFEMNGAIPIKYLPQAPGDSRIDFPAEDAYLNRTVAASLVLGVVFLFAGFAANQSRKSRINAAGNAL